jgi:hypothetical protein
MRKSTNVRKCNYHNVIIQHPVALYRCDFGAFVPSMYNVVHYSVFDFLYWTPRFGLTGHVQVYMLLWLRILLFKRRKENRITVSSRILNHNMYT